MQLIPCPYCGPRAQTEFAYIRSTDAIIPLDTAPAEAMERLYNRANPRGVDEELWRHSYGCRQWLTIRRDRVTHVIDSVTPYREIPA